MRMALRRSAVLGVRIPRSLRQQRGDDVIAVTHVQGIHRLHRLGLACPAVITATTTTTEVQRVVGDPLPLWVWWGAGILLLVFIVAGGLWARQKMNRS